MKQSETRKAQAKKSFNPASELLSIHLKELGLAFEREVIFHPLRKWRLDFLLTDSKVAVEIEGGAFTQGRHTRGQGFENDCVKYNHATVAGIRVLRFSTGQVLAGVARAFLKEHLCGS